MSADPGVDEGDMSTPIFGQGDNIQVVPPIICPKTIKFKF